MKIYLVLFFAAVLQVWSVQGHGRLMKPPARNSLWRFGFPSPVDYNDNELYCGGFSVQWSQNGGKCGVCGDSWSDPAPRLHETGGLYAVGLIGKRYTPGQIIDVEIELTANHKGYFELRLCPTNDPNIEETQECFNQYPLYLAGQSSYRYYIPDNSKKQETFNYQVKLPDGVTCTHCVMQWIYYTGNTWGTCENGTSGIGCGIQETFRNCADFSIITNTASYGPSGTVPATSNSILAENPYAVVKLVRNNETGEETYEAYVNKNQVCIPTEKYARVPNMDAWCMVNCLKYPPTCPESVCHCITNCVPVGDKAKEEGTETHCHINCLRYPHKERCPSWCKCT